MIKAQYTGHLLHLPFLVGFLDFGSIGKDLPFNLSNSFT